MVKIVKAENGDLLINKEDRTETVFKNGIAKVTLNGYTGYIDKLGNWVNYQE